MLTRDLFLVRPTNLVADRVHKKASQMFYTVTLKVVNKFPQIWHIRLAICA